MIGLVAMLAVGVSAPQQPTQATIQLPPSVVVTGHMVVDFDADGREDLVLACRDTSSGRRTVQRHARQVSGPAFSSRPTGEPFAIDRDVVAFTFCDCRPAPGPELVLLTNEQVVAVVVDAKGAPQFERLLRHRLVWPAADPDKVVPLPRSAIDFDRDGDTDLLLPQPDGWSVWLQDEGSFDRRAEFSLPLRENRFGGVGARGRSGGSLEIAFGEDQGGNEEGAGAGSRRPGGAALVSTAARTAPCQLVDFDGNGLDDLLAFRNGKCFAALQTSPGVVERRDLPLPLPEDRLKLLDPSFDLQFADLDGDGRADLLMTTSARRDDDLEARIDWYRTQADGTWPTQRSGRLRLQPMAAPAQLVDVDGDGRPDLVCLSVRTSAMRAITGDSAAALDAQVSVFSNDGEGFVRPAALSQALPLAPGAGGLSEPFVAARPGFDGKPRGMLLRADGAVQLRPLTPRGSRFRLAPAAMRIEVPDDARVVTTGIDGAEVLIITDHEVRHVRLSR